MDSKILNDVNTSLSKIEEIYAEIKIHPNIAVALLDSYILDKWHTLNRHYLEYISHRSKESLVDLLHGRHLSVRYEVLKKNFEKLFQSQLYVFEKYKDNWALSVDRYTLYPINISQNKSGEVLEFYNSILEEDNNVMQCFEDNTYEDEFFNGEDIDKFEWHLLQYTKFSSISLGSCDIATSLSVLYKAWSVISSYKDHILDGQSMTIEDIMNVVISEFKKTARKMRNQVLRDLKHKAQEFRKTEDNIWEKMLEIEEESLRLAVKGILRSSDNEDFDYIPDFTKSRMEDNNALMQKISQVCLYDELFNFQQAAENHVNLYMCLNKDNVDLFFDIVLKRDIILSQLNPTLSAEFDEFLKEEPNKKRIELSEEDKSNLNKILKLVDKGNWQLPATFDNIKDLLNTLFGADTTHLDVGDYNRTQEFRMFFKKGRTGSNSSRVEISMANILGYFKKHNYLVEGSSKISQTFFGDAEQIGNIDKGYNQNASQDFATLEDLMDKYRKKIILS